MLLTIHSKASTVSLATFYWQSHLSIYAYTTKVHLDKLIDSLEPTVP